MSAASILTTSAGICAAAARAELCVYYYPNIIGEAPLVSVALCSNFSGFLTTLHRLALSQLVAYCRICSRPHLSDDTFGIFSILSTGS